MLSALLKESIFQSGWRCPEKFAGSFKLLTKFATIFKRVTNFPKARSLILWTERGAARHAKMLETDQAWEVFEKLEDCYFSQCKKNTGKQEKSTNELSAKEANSLVWLWDYANRSQALFRELYPALKQIQSNYSGRCYDYGHEFSYVIGMARDVLINHTRDVDINEPDGPTNLSAWVRLKNKELPPSLHRY